MRVNLTQSTGNPLRSTKSDYGYHFILITDTKNSARCQIVRFGELGAARFHSRHPQSNECSDVRKEELQLPSSHFVPSIQWSKALASLHPPKESQFVQSASVVEPRGQHSRTGLHSGPGWACPSSVERRCAANRPNRAKPSLGMVEAHQLFLRQSPIT